MPLLNGCHGNWMLHYVMFVRIMEIGNMPWRGFLYFELCVYVDLRACEWVQAPLESRRGHWISWTCYQLLDVAARNWTRVLSRAESALNTWVILHHLISMAPGVGIKIRNPNWKCLSSSHIQLQLCWIFCICSTDNNVYIHRGGQFWEPYCLCSI